VLLSFLLYHLTIMKNLSLLLTIAPLFNLTSQSAFVESSHQLGIDHYHRGLMGGGVAIFDFNNDGFQDIYLTGGQFADKLYKNNGNGSFTDITAYAGLDTTAFHNTMSVTTGDINNDGWRDIFIGTDQARHNLLYLNNGNGTFSEISQSAGLDLLEWAMGAVFTDINLDGRLDLYIVNYIRSQQALLDDQGEVNGFAHDCFPNRLYLNNGDLTFTDVTFEYGVGDIGCALAVMATDLNEDYLSDLYVANDFGAWVSPNEALLNNRSGQGFEPVGPDIGMNAGIYAMGIAEGDYNFDGLMDYYVTNLGRNVLYQHQTDGTYEDVTTNAGVESTIAIQDFATGWGCAFIDYDHDGDEDLLVSNGWVPAAAFIGNDVEDPNRLFENLGDGTFADVSSSAGFESPLHSRGLAVGDLDNDGDQDVVVANVAQTDGEAHTLVYLNQESSEQHWLKVLLVGHQANHDGIGAKVRAYAGERQWVEEVHGGSSHASQHSTILHFGLGAYSTLDSVVVFWPGGKRQAYQNMDADQLILIEEDVSGYLIAGCTDVSAQNYNVSATFDYGCFREVVGCMDPTATNFSLSANRSSDDCEYEEEVITALKALSGGSFAIYPNPVNQYLNVRDQQYLQQEVSIEIMDLSGKVLTSDTFNGQYQWNRGAIQAGIYLLNLRSRHGTYTQRIILR